MKELPFNNQLIQQAQKWAEELGELNNSITKGRGNLAGRVGELAFARYLGVVLLDMKDYDLTYKGEKLEVKTKRRTATPLPHYDVSIPATSAHQRPDRYVFISLEFERKSGRSYYGLQKIWLVGDMGADEYFKKAHKYTKGVYTGSNRFLTLADMWNMPISNLDQSFQSL